MAKDYFADTSISGLDEPMIDPNLVNNLTT